jgi:arylsulfatase
MHVWTRLKQESQGVTGLGIYPDGMVEHDGHIGQLLDKLDELGIAENTIVMYSTDNGAETFTWPDGGTTPFRGEKNTNWEGGYRVPTAIRWPGVIEPGTVYNDPFSHEDMLPTLLAAVGEGDIKERLMEGGVDAIGRTYKAHIDGYNLMPYFKGEVSESPRDEFLYWTDDGDLAALRYNNWKVVFMEQRSHGFDVWQDPLVVLRFPKLMNLRTDPFERADHEAIGYGQWRAERMFALAPAQLYVGNWIKSFQEFPPRQKPGSFSLSNAMEKMTSGSPNN